MRVDFKVRAHLLGKNEFSFFVYSVAGDLLATRSILTTLPSDRGREADGKAGGEALHVHSPQRDKQIGLLLCFGGDKPKPGLLAKL